MGEQFVSEYDNIFHEKELILSMRKGIELHMRNEWYENMFQGKQPDNCVRASQNTRANFISCTQEKKNHSTGLCDVVDHYHQQYKLLLLVN